MVVVVVVVGASTVAETGDKKWQHNFIVSVCLGCSMMHCAVVLLLLLLALVLLQR